MRHKDLLNELIKGEISLLDTSFHVLLKTPEVLDLPNKNACFMKKMKEKRTMLCHPNTEV